jgi:hypothetical protein
MDLIEVISLVCRYIQAQRGRLNDCCGGDGAQAELDQECTWLLKRCCSAWIGQQRARPCGRLRALVDVRIRRIEALNRDGCGAEYVPAGGCAGMSGSLLPRFHATSSGGEGMPGPIAREG